MLEVLVHAARCVTVALAELEDWGPAGTRPGQYRSDLVADAAAVAALDSAGFGVLSEESGLTHEERELLVVLDPLDGSTNAARGIPWFATSLCVLDGVDPVAALVVNQATGAHYRAIRDGGASRDGRSIAPSHCARLDQAILGCSDYPPRHLGWRQYRTLGAAALDLCAVADGALDAFLDCGVDAHGPWDYLAGAFICSEAGAAVSEVAGRDLVVRDPRLRRAPVAAANASLLSALLSSFHGTSRAEDTPPRLENTTGVSPVTPPAPPSPAAGSAATSKAARIEPDPDAAPADKRLASP
jgi:myo-inositol-1(or 4)-monophosphatase